MNIEGNPANWADLFPEHLIPDILELVLDAWSKFRKPRRDEHEVPITKRFRDSLRRANHNGPDLPFRIHVEIDTPQNDFSEAGRVDLTFEPTTTNREEVYFAFECKRLRVHYESSMKPQAHKYVGGDGMMCFLTGKYSSGLTHAGMLGYVMDADYSKAITAVEAQIEKNRTRLCLMPNTSLDKSTLRPDCLLTKQSNHSTKNRRFRIHHLFLPVTN